MAQAVLPQPVRTYYASTEDDSGKEETITTFIGASRTVISTITQTLGQDVMPTATITEQGGIALSRCEPSFGAGRGGRAWSHSERNPIVMLVAVAVLMGLL